MSTFKKRLYEICGEVASEFQDWIFLSGTFTNKKLRHTTIAISPGFSFARNSTPLQPAILINHKKSMDLFKNLNGYELPTSTLQFQNVAQMLEYMPDDLRQGCYVLEDKNLQMTLAPPSELAKKRMVDVTEAQPVLRAMMMDGIAIIDKLYDLSSEENLLINFPPKYNTRSNTIPYDEFERNKGVMVCVVRALLGDFDFVEEYRSDGYRTIFPKRIKEIDNIMAALPELKRLYARANKAI
jgi:hypothetical protein